MTPGANNGHVIGEINITPLTDVMLTLLVMFLLTAAFLMAAQVLEVELPPPVASDQPPAPGEGRVVVQVDREGRFSVGGRPVEDRELTRAVMEEAAQVDADRKVVVVQGHREAPYGRIIWVMDSARLIGLPYVSLTADEEER